MDNKMSADLYLINAKVVTDQEVFNGGVVIVDGKIAEVVHGDRPVQAARVIDLEGKLLMPGVIDGHVHINEPGRSDWEGYQTGSKAAAAGGITTLLDMPLNSIPYTTNRAALTMKREAACGQSVVDYGHWGGFVDNNLADLDELNEDGVIGFKAFASNSGVDFERVNDDMIFAGLKKMAELGNIMGLHAENEFVTRYLSQKMQSDGRTDRSGWYESRPPETELEAVLRSCFWAKTTGGNLHVVHVSIPDGIRAIAKAKQEGVRVTSETCPHFLFFDHADFERIGPAAKCAPPIRSRAHVDELWDCVLSGLVDVIGSDHSPCLWSDKEKGMDNIWKAWGGISGMQTMLPALLTEGVHKRGLPLTSLVKMLSSNPARLYGIDAQKGTLQPGCDADLVVVDLDREWTLTADQLYYKNQHSAYVGCTFKGMVMQTLVRGKTVYRDGLITEQPGYGMLLRRDHAHRY
jgi:allantoinase